MKKLLLVAFTAFAFTTMHAQENVIKANPLGLAFGSAHLSYERALDLRKAIEISLSYTSLDAVFSNRNEDKLNGFGIEGKYKFYFSEINNTPIGDINNAPRGYYVAPVASFSSISGDSGDQTGKVSVIGVGALAGYQWLFTGASSGFALDFNLGIQYAHGMESGDINGLTVQGVLPRIGLSFGYAW